MCACQANFQLKQLMRHSFSASVDVMVSVSVCCRGILKLTVVCVRTYCISLIMSSSSYPKYTGILLEALNLWYHNPAVTTPVLKLMAELVLNRSQVLRRVCVCACVSE